MIDIIEHIPRHEVEQIIPILYKALKPGGCLLVHTPLYKEDVDVLHKEISTLSADSTDIYEETKGMHINRYSYESLGDQFQRFGFKRYNDYIFLKPTNCIPVWNYQGRGKRKLAKVFGYHFS
jgi:hypothetical protein